MLSYFPLIGFLDIMQLYTRIKYTFFFISRILNFKQMNFKLVSGAKTHCIIILTALHGRLTTYTYLHKQSNSSISHGIRKPKDSTAHNRIAQIKYWHSKGSSTWMLHRGKTITKHITIIKWRKPASGNLDLKSKSKNYSFTPLKPQTHTLFITFNLQSLFHTSFSPNSIQVKSSGFQDLHLHNGCKKKMRKKKS